jgi:hypothetical protein
VCKVIFKCSETKTDKGCDHDRQRGEHHNEIGGERSPPAAADKECEAECKNTYAYQVTRKFEPTLSGKN